MGWGPKSRYRKSEQKLEVHLTLEKNTALEGNRGREGRLNRLDTRHNNEKINLINTAVYPVITLAYLQLFM
jgi:hypothetical protein